MATCCGRTFCIRGLLAYLLSRFEPAPAVRFREPSPAELTGHGYAARWLR